MHFGCDGYFVNVARTSWPCLLIFDRENRFMCGTSAHDNKKNTPEDALDVLPPIDGDYVPSRVRITN